MRGVWPWYKQTNMPLHMYLNKFTIMLQIRSLGWNWYHKIMKGFSAQYLWDLYLARVSRLGVRTLWLCQDISLKPRSSAMMRMILGGSACFPRAQEPRIKETTKMSNMVGWPLFVRCSVWTFTPGFIQSLIFVETQWID